MPPLDPPLFAFKNRTHHCKNQRSIRHIVVIVLPAQGMIALRREATTLTHEDYMDGILEVQAKKKANLNYYA